MGIVGIASQATVVFTGGVVNTTGGAGVMVIVLDTDVSGLPQISVAVHVSVMDPPHGPGVALNVDGLDVPLIKHVPLNPFVYDNVPEVGVTPQASVIPPGAVMVGNAAGVTVIVLDTGARALPQMSVAVHVSVIVPPHGPGVTLNVDELEVPLIKQVPLCPFVYGSVDDAGVTPHAILIPAGAVIVGSTAGETVIVLETDASGRPQISVAVHVSVIVPPHAPGVAVNVDVLEVPLMRHDPLSPLEKGSVDEVGTVPHAIVIEPGAVIVGRAAGVTVIVLDTATSVLPQASVAVHVSVTVPPHAFGDALNVEGFEEPVIRQVPLSPLEYTNELATGNAPHATVIPAGAVMVGSAAGKIVIILETDASGRPQMSVAVQVSVIVPPQFPGIVLNVDVFDVPLIKQPPLCPFVYGSVLDAGVTPHAILIPAGAVMVGRAPGLIVIT
jgi:hypothetical protein